jgi:hypothetical protein
MLQCAVDGIPDLRQVRINAAHSKQTGNPMMTLQQYTPLLLSASEAYDTSLKIAKVHSKRQQAYHTEIMPYYDSDEDDEPPFTVNTYLANVTKSRLQPIQSRKSKVHNTNQRNFIPKEDWMRIPEDVREKLTNQNRNSNNHRSSRAIHNVNGTFSVHKDTDSDNRLKVMIMKIIILHY